MKWFPFVFPILLLFLLVHLSADSVRQMRTIQEIVDEVLRHNPELQGMEADLAIAKGQRVQAGMWKNPDLTLMYANRRVQNADTTADHGFSDMVALSQTFEFPGKATLRKALADKDVAMATAGLREFREALAGKARLLAYRCALTEENRLAAAVTVKRAQELVALLEKRPKVGMQALFDSGILQGNLAELTTSERELGQEALAVRSELNLLRGWPAETEVTVDSPGPLPKLPTDFNRFSLDAMKTSPILALKAMALQKSKMQVGASKLDVAPDFVIQPYYSLDKAADHDQKIGANLTVTLPIWNQNQGNIAAAKAAVTRAEANMQQARDDLNLALAHDFESRRLIAEQLGSLGPELTSRMADLADLADRQYRLGAINLQTFLETQRQYIATIRSVNQARLDDATAEIDLELLAGVQP